MTEKRLNISITSSSSQRYDETLQVNDSNGVYKLDPDYKPKYMYPSRGEKPLPNDDLELAPYHSWFAGSSHCDYSNNQTYSNRYLLVGRPQVRGAMGTQSQKIKLV